MTLIEAIQILETHNKWRRGAEIPMEEPKKIGIAIDFVIEFCKNQKEQPIEAAPKTLINNWD